MSNYREHNQCSVQLQSNHSLSSEKLLSSDRRSSFFLHVQNHPCFLISLTCGGNSFFRFCLMQSHRRTQADRKPSAAPSSQTTRIRHYSASASNAVKRGCARAVSSCVTAGKTNRGSPLEQHTDVTSGGNISPSAHEAP